MIDPNQPKFYKVKELPEHILALVLKMWERELGGLPKDADRIVFTYFKGIYTKDKIAEDLYIHEMAHFIRQGNGENQEMADQWWRQYCEDKDFRYQEELLAYKEQWKYIVGRKKLNRQQAFEAARYFAHELCSPKYGNLGSEMTALNAIMKK